MEDNANRFQKAVPHIPPSSSIVFISSDVTETSSLPPHFLLYTATKGAVNQMVRALARGLAKQGIRVNAVFPVVTGTELFFKLNSEETIQMLAEINPFKRIGESDDIAAGVSLFWRKENGWVTGQILTSNGGST
jgi:Dehydrogenases with different specificities (related to short-chain alcohol dehydrogenases)